MEKVRVLSGYLVLGSSIVTQGQVGIVHLLVDGIERLKHGLVRLVSRGLSPHHLISGGASIRYLVHDDHLILLNLALHLAKRINLLAHLSSCIGLFPLEVGEDGLLLDVGSLHVLPQLLHLGLPLLVELDLSGGGSTGLGEPVAQLVDLPGHVRPLPLSLGSGLPFGLKLLLHCLNTTLDLLDSLLGLGNQVLLIIQFSGKLSIVLFLVANNHFEVPLGSLKVSNRILCHLQFALNLPLLLLKGSSSLLFFVQASLELTESRLQLRLNGRQMSNLFIGSDHVIVRLGLGLTNVLLLLVQFVDHLILLGDLILEYLNGVVTVALLQLDLGDGQFDVLDLFLDHADRSAVGLDLSCQSDPGRFLLAEDSLLLGKLCLSLCLEGRGLGLPVRVDRDTALLLLQLLSHGLDVLLETIQTSLKGLSHIKSLLVLAVARVGLFLELPELLLRVW